MRSIAKYLIAPEVWLGFAKRNAVLALTAIRRRLSNTVSFEGTKPEVVRPILAACYNYYYLQKKKKRERTTKQTKAEGKSREVFGERKRNCADPKCHLTGFA